MRWLKQPVFPWSGDRKTGGPCSAVDVLVRLAVSISAIDVSEYSSQPHSIPCALITGQY